MAQVEIQTVDDIWPYPVPSKEEQFSPYGIGRRTYDFVRSCRKDPVLWEKIQTRAAEIRANGEYNLSAADRTMNEKGG